MKRIFWIFIFFIGLTGSLNAQLMGGLIIPSSSAGEIISLDCNGASNSQQQWLTVLNTSSASVDAFDGCNFADFRSYAKRISASDNNKVGINGMSGCDVFTVILDADNGNSLFSSAYVLPGNDGGLTIVSDVNNNFVASGGLGITNNGQSNFTTCLLRKIDSNSILTHDNVVTPTSPATRIALTDLSTDNIGNSYGYGVGYSGSANLSILHKFSPAGTLLWRSIINEYDWFYGYPGALTIDPSGNPIFTGKRQTSSSPSTYDIVVRKVASNGTQLWQIYYHVGEDYIHNITTDAQGDIYFTMEVRNVGNRVVKLSGATGNVVWSTQYHTGSSLGGNIKINANGNVIVGYSQTKAFDASTGVLLWTSNANGHHLDTDNNSKIYTVNNNKVLILNPNGTHLDSITIAIPNFTVTLRDVVVSGNSFYVTGKRVNGGDSKIFVAKFLKAYSTGMNINVSYTGGNGGTHSGQTVSSTGVTGLTAILAAGTFANGAGSLTYSITGTPSASGTASFALNIGGQSCTLSIPVSSPAPSYPTGTVHCLGTPTAVVDITNPTTGKTWMDRNLGASQAATSSTDTVAYGDLYQWGRRADGHQCRNSATTSTLSSIDQPGHGDFITSNSGANWDWRSPQNTNLWQGANGINNPCPNGYRLPTSTEFNAERLSWSSNNAAGAFASPLKLPMSGRSDRFDASLYSVGTSGYYWSSSAGTTNSFRLRFQSTSSDMNAMDRANGASIRCIKELSIGAIGAIGALDCNGANIPTNGLVGWWPFNGNANDESGNGNNGIVNGTTLTSDRFGFSNSAFHFNNSGNIQAGQIQFQNYVSSGFSVSYWFTMEDSTTTNRHFLITNYDGINGLQIEYGPSSTNTLRHSLRTGAGSPPEINYFESFSVFNTWKHAVIVWSPPIMSTYINGVLTNQTTGNQISNLSVCCNVKTYFGSPWSTTNDNHKGKLDDIAIWNRALTPQEVNGVFNDISLVQGVTVSSLPIHVSYSGGNGGTHNGQTVTSTGVTGLTATLAAGTFANGAGSLTYSITGTPSASGTASFALNIGGQSCTLSIPVSSPAPSYPTGTVHCLGTPTAVVDVTNPTTGKTWMDRNLGASQAATSSTDAASYGDLYQWGRGSDGHQCRNSDTIMTISTTIYPSHGSFIVGEHTALHLSQTGCPYLWQCPQDDNLWQGANGINNPCPIGYRLPTEIELEEERLSWNQNNSSGAFSSPLKFALAGYRQGDGAIIDLGTSGIMRSSSLGGNLLRSSQTLNFSQNSASSGNLNSRTFGFSVRCIKD